MRKVMTFKRGPLDGKTRETAADCTRYCHPFWDAGGARLNMAFYCRDAPSDPFRPEDTFTLLTYRYTPENGDRGEVTRTAGARSAFAAALRGSTRGRVR